MSTQGCEVGGVMAVESPSISTDLPNSETKVQNGAKKKPGSSWLAGDRHVLPRNNLPVVVFALALGVFLAALDQTIVATSLPTIVAQLGGGNNYSWVGSAYLLATASMAPLMGKLANLLGRKQTMFPAILIFMFGSALCGAAKTMNWLIISRAVQGVGGAGIQQMTQIILSDIVSLEDRGKYSSALGSAWGIASIIGPLAGGALTDHVSWRWCFWINLPTGAIVVLLLFFTLHLNSHESNKTFQQHVAEFDFLGLFILVTGIICVLIGFNESEIAWNQASTISLLVIGVVLLVVGAIHEGYTKRSPIIPPRLFRTRTTGIVLTTTFLHALCFFATAYYLPLYFQILGASATRAGIEMLPYSLSSSVTSAGGAIIVAFTGDFKLPIVGAWIISTLGYGLMTILDERSSLTIKVVLPLIAGLGIGILFQPLLIAIQAAMPHKDMPTTTATFGLLRTLGATVGVSIGQIIFSSELRRRIRNVEGFNMDTTATNLLDSVRELKNIEPVSLRLEVFHAYTKGITSVWVVCTPILGVCLILSLFLKTYSLKRNVVRASDKPKKDGDTVTQLPPETVDTAKGSLTVEKVSESLPEVTGATLLVKETV